MKKSLLVICALCLALCAKAQESASVDTATEELNSGVSWNYMAIEDAFGIGFQAIINHIAIDASLRFGETDSPVTTNEAWSVGIGGNYRYWFTERVFIEGTAGIQYYKSKFEWMEGKRKYKESDGNFGLFLTPKIGVHLFKLGSASWGLQAGYRWDFNKFKFSKEYTADYFTIGIVGVI